MINQADLAQKNTQFTTDQARQIEGLLIDFFNQQENRSLEEIDAERNYLSMELVFLMDVLKSMVASIIL